MRIILQLFAAISCLFPSQQNFRDVVMLRNRSRAVTSKQALMSDHSSQSSSTQNHRKSIPSLFATSPRFRALTFKGLPDAEQVNSPTSILDTTKPFTCYKNPFSCDTNQPRSPKVLAGNMCPWEKQDSKGIGVALMDYTPTDHKPIKDDCFNKLGNRMILFGTKLKVQIPPLPVSPVDSPTSPVEFGIKTRSSQLSSSVTGNSSIQTKDSPRVFTGCLTLSEMELSEDYTCVISRGPNPKTTHIFDNCIVENYCSLSDKYSSAPKDFLSFCFTCNKNLDQENDIYIYRGDKAFCSHECRYQEMELDCEEN